MPRWLRGMPRVSRRTSGGTSPNEDVGLCVADVAPGVPRRRGHRPGRQGPGGDAVRARLAMVQGAHRQGDTDPVADGEQRRGGVAGGGRRETDRIRMGVPARPPRPAGVHGVAHDAPGVRMVGRRDVPHHHVHGMGVVRMGAPRRPNVAEIVWELGHGLWHAVRESSERVDQYDRMRTPIPGDLVIELTHRYGPRARIDPNRIGWMIGGDAFRPLVPPLDSPDRSVSFDQGVWIALPIRDETFNPDGRTGADHPAPERAARPAVTYDPPPA